MRGSRRGAVLAIVIWSVAIAAIVVAAVQILSYRQATMGVEALGRVQARWAARAGVETMLAIMEYHTEHPDATDPMSVVRDLENNAFGELDTGSFDIRHFRDGAEWAGPLDEHSRMNINRVTKTELLNIQDMTPDVVDAIVDWKDANDEIEATGAEAQFYGSRGLTYAPRNANLRSVGELELVAGCWPEFVRGEDWNLNNRLDPSEDDGETTWPDDNPDGVLEYGWTGLFTASSRAATTGLSGEPLLNLRETTAEEVVARTGLAQQQAEQVVQWGKSGSSSMEQLLTTPLESLASGSSSGGARSGRSSGGRPTGSTLPQEQLRAIFAECTMDDLTRPQPGRININSASRRVLEEVLDLNPRLVDTIIARRDASAEGLTSVVDLLAVDGMTPQILGSLAKHIGVVSSVYSITSRGRSASTGAMVEMYVVVDRSSLPAKVLEYREQ